MSQTLTLHGYHVWANELVFEHLKKLPGDIWSQALNSVFPSIQATMSHIYAMDAMWLNVMQGGTFEEARTVVVEQLSQSSNLTIQHMQERYSLLATDYRRFISSLDTDTSIAISHPAFGTVSTAMTDLVQHVVNHGTYHRGNITAMLHQCGQKGVPTDYMFYLFSLSKS